MNIALLGYGKMGKTIERLALGKGHSVGVKADGSDVSVDLWGIDVAIEFSVPEAAVKNITSCFEQGVPVVSGTTGWLDRYEEVLKICEERNGSFIYASNFSIGVNLFFSLNEHLAQLMQSRKEYEPNIFEIHHTQKLDAPSGTAISLAEGIIENSDKSGWKLTEAGKHEIPIQAVRMGDVKGTHQIDYISDVDTISIRHEAHSREGFAKGALLAAEWLKDKKGVYSMKDVLRINN